MDWWRERYDRLLVSASVELDEEYDPQAFVEGRAPEVVKLCRLSALARDSEHPDLGYRSELGRKIRANYFLVLKAYRSHAERFGAFSIELPEWDKSTDVPNDQQVTRMLRSWDAERWVADDVGTIRTALGAHLARLDEARDRATRAERKVLNRTLFLVGAEAQAMYNCVTRISRATRTDRRRFRKEEGPGGS